MTEKLQKVLADLGLGSRREMEVVIAQGRVHVNGAVAKLGDRVDRAADIRLDNHGVQQHKEQGFCRVLMYHKPEGELCTRHDPQGRATVFDRLPSLQHARWISVGRLDINTSGLLLFTTDGELAHKLMHPSMKVAREYAVRVFGQVTDDMLQKLKQGVQLDDGLAAFETISSQGGDGLNRWFKVILKEGRQREVRRLWESQGLHVSRLIRIRYGQIVLSARVPRGGWVDLSVEEIQQLRKSVGLKPISGKQISHDSKHAAQKLQHQDIMRMRRAAKKHQSQRDTQHKKTDVNPSSLRECKKWPKDAKLIDA